MEMIISEKRKPKIENNKKIDILLINWNLTMSNLAETNEYLANLPLGWFLSNKEESESLYIELQKELSQGHILYGKEVKIVAHRNGTDDILCQHILESDHYTVIHLTWSMKQETDIYCPTVEVDGSFRDFIDYENRFLQQQ